MKETTTTTKENNLKTSTSQMGDNLRNFNGTTIIGITTLTDQDEYYTGVDPDSGKYSGKVANKMITRLQLDPKKLKKELDTRVLLTTCDYSTLLENIKKRQLDANVLEFLENVDFGNIDAEIKFHEAIKEEKESMKYVAGERKNGENINNALVLSKKDEHPMINVYFCVKASKTIKYFYDGKEFDTDKIKSYKKPAKVEGKRQMEFGIKKEKVLTIRNYRLENVKQIRMNGEVYDIED